MDDGVFHDAHEVYVRTSAEADWTWIGTFASKSLAANYSVSSAIPATCLVEVRPV